MMSTQTMERTNNFMPQTKVTVRRKRVLMDCGRGLEWRWFFQAHRNGVPVGYPQATRKLAKNWAREELEKTPSTAGLTRLSPKHYTSTV
jgi:hypothetical protein